MMQEIASWQGYTYYSRLVCKMSENEYKVKISLLFFFLGEEMGRDLREATLFCWIFFGFVSRDFGLRFKIEVEGGLGMMFMLFLIITIAIGMVLGMIVMMCYGDGLYNFIVLCG